MVSTIFAYVSPFIAAGLTYFFNIKTHKKVTDLEKEKCLNETLSNLLDSIHYLGIISSLFELLAKEKDDMVLPVHTLPSIMLKSGMLNDQCFYDLDKSIANLKKHDSLVYFKISGIGNEFLSLKKMYILPYLENPNLDKNFFKVGPNKLIDKLKIDLNQNSEFIAKEFNRNKRRKINKYLTSLSVVSADEIVEKLEVEHYNSIISLIPDNEQKPSFEEYKQASKSEDFKKSFKIQEDILKKDNLQDFLKEISETKDLSELSLDDIQEMLKNKS